MALGLWLSLGLNTSYAAPNCPANELLTQPRPPALMNVVVVAGYSSGVDFAPQLKARGVGTVISVHPAPIPKTFRPLYEANKQHFNEELTFNGDLDALVAQLTAGGRKIDAVFAGNETGVPMTNELNHRLGLKGNDPAMSPYHRVKSLMQERIDQAGLSSIAGFKTASADAALEWVKTKNKGAYPVVVKPLDGAATQGFNLCFNEAQVRAAFASLVGTKTYLDGAINEVLVQRYVNAEEYVVNTVSRDGSHFVTEIWHYKKNEIRRPDGGHSKIYDYDRLVPFDSPEAAQLLPYAYKVLDALKIVNGPGHMELMLPAEGPVLMEVGTRLMGGRAYRYTRDALGTSMLDVTIDAALFPEQYAANAKSGVTMRKHIRNIQLVSSQSGVVTKVNYTAEELKKLLPSFAGMGISGVGDTLTPTIDLISSPGNVWLISESPKQLEADYRRFRDEIEPRLYEVRAQDQP